MQDEVTQALVDALRNYMFYGDIVPNEVLKQAEEALAKFEATLTSEEP